jgi:hypothetical protein
MCIFQAQEKVYGQNRARTMNPEYAKATRKDTLVDLDRVSQCQPGV